jgi:DNA-binding transcriptional regulator YdaS (Cro superfamily)
MTEKEALERAIEIAGGQSALARSCPSQRITQQNIWVWLQRGYCAPYAVLEIEAATGVSRHDLCPELYPREAA